MQDLADRGLEPDRVAAITRTLEKVPGVLSAHELRTRMVGHQLFIDVHVQVAPYLSVSEGHQIGDWAMHCVRQAHSEVTDITLHVDPENDSVIEKRDMAPLRPTVVNALREFPTLSTYHRMVIHYRSQQIEIELYFADTPGTRLRSERDQAISRLPWLTQLTLYGPPG